MHSRKISTASSSTADIDTNQLDGLSYGSADDFDRDVMCLVYPDGRITTVDPDASPS